MNPRLIATLFALAATSQAVRAADADHPFKNAKMGDFVTYKLMQIAPGMEMEGSVTFTVSASSDKEVTIKVSGMMGDRPLPEQTQKIDVTKPYDPSTVGAMKGWGGPKAKVEKLDAGKEKLTVGDKTYETTWTTYKFLAKSQEFETVADLKVWMSKDIPLGVLKTETITKLVGAAKATNMTMTFLESGTKKQ